MALNFSSCSTFSNSIVHNDDELYRSRYEEGHSYGYPFLSGWEAGNSYGYIGGDRRLTDMGTAFDPVDLLPDDPFGMEIEEGMGAALAGFFEVSGSDLFGWTLFCPPDGWVEDCGGCSLESSTVLSVHESGHQYTEYNVQPVENFTGLTLYEPQYGFMECDGWPVGSFTGVTLDDAHAQHEYMESQCCPVESFTGLSVHDTQHEFIECDLVVSESLDCNPPEKEGGLPHEGLLFSLGYLDVRDLLSVQGVCRSLRLAVQNDALLWRSIYIDSPLSEKITDDILLQLTERAQRNLQSLSLLGCSRITDDGLKCVLENNPMLRKLRVPGCVRLSLDGIINTLKALQLQGTPGIQHITLGRLFSVSEQQFGELKMLVGKDQHQQPQVQKPRFYHTVQSSFSTDDDHVIDIEICPECLKFKLVYDCPSDSCQGNSPRQCRACDVCIPRCIHCGKCIKDCRYVETFCLDYLCSDCWREPPGGCESIEEK